MTSCCNQYNQTCSNAQMWVFNLITETEAMSFLPICHYLGVSFCIMPTVLFSDHETGVLMVELQINCFSLRSGKQSTVNGLLSSTMKAWVLSVSSSLFISLQTSLSTLRQGNELHTAPAPALACSPPCLWQRVVQERYSHSLHLYDGDYRIIIIEYKINPLWFYIFTRRASF